VTSRWLDPLARWGAGAWKYLAAAGVVVLLGLGAGVLALYCFAELAEGVLRQETLAMDRAVLEALRAAHSPLLDRLAHGVTVFGAEGLVVVLVVVVAGLATRGRWNRVTTVIVVTIGAQLLNDVLKGLFRRARPVPVESILPVQAFSFPSGHAMVSASFYLFLAYLAWQGFRGRARILVPSGLIVLILLIGVSRLYLGVHYLTDVLAGYVAGFVWVDAVVLALHFMDRRRLSLAQARAG
jgi:undecaprenyl-diphosphatase